MCSSCKTVKKIFEKEKQSVSVLQKNDVEFDQNIKTDLDIIHLDKSESFSMVPVDPHKPSRVIRGKDTLDFTNTRIEVHKNDVTTNTKDNSIVNTHKKDQSQKESNASTKQVKRDVEKKGMSPALIWGSLLFLFLAGLIWYFKK